MKFTRQILSSKNQKGVAILMAVFCVVMITYIVNEVTYDSNIEYAIHAQAVNRIKAYYAARSGLEMSLLRIKIYKKVQTQFGKQLGGNAGMLNLIWSFPLSWPPVLPENTSSVEKDNIQDKVKEAKMDSGFNATIFDEGSKLDINDLASPSKVIRDLTKKQLNDIFAQKMELDQNWAREHQDFKYNELVNNIIDWLDADKESLNGGDEHHLYSDKQENYPPNRAFRSLDELRLVAGMKDDYFKLLEPLVTVYGAKAINPNTAPKEVLQALDKTITDEVIAEILKRRDNPKEGGSFTSAKDFWEFTNSKGARVPQETQDQTPISTDAVTNFKIRAIGEFHGAIREIDAIVFDVAGAASAIADKVKKESSTSGSGSGTATNPTPTPTPAAGTPAGNSAAANQTPSKGPPRIVYWFEK